MASVSSRNESSRIEALRSLDILDTEAEKDFDDIVKLASRICNTPISLVSLIDSDRQWFKANHGLESIHETPRDIAFCSYAIENDNIMIVPDATHDSRFANNPLVTGNPDIRFYAGMPLVTSNGYKIGTLCVIDRKPKQIDEQQADCLRTLSTQVMKLIELRQTIKQLKLAEQELRTAKQKAEQATQIKSQFLSTMSHEIRTPMNAVIGLTHMLLQRSPREDQMQDLQLLKFSGENLLTIINDILDFNKIEAGKMDLENISFHLHDLIHNCKSLYENKCIEKGIALIISIGNNVPQFVKGDLVRLNQILTNLISNAIKFTEKGQVQLRVTAIKLKENFQIKFFVQDTGIGIPEDKLAHVFQDFTQANSDTTRKYGGTGLGLAITKKLVELMGGNIKIASIVGIGSIFSFELLMEQGEALSAIDLKKNEEGDSALNGKILLVEDNKVNQIVASNFLNKWGLQVDFANDGSEALDLIKGKSYDIVLMDLQMPGMDGFTTAQQVRNFDEPYFTNIPIIALTASAMSEVKDKVFQFGMNDYLTKPFDPSELRTKIIKYLPANKLKLKESPIKETLEIFTMGDVEYRSVLSGLIAKNIAEMMKVVNTIDHHKPDTFFKTYHKIKQSLAMIGDESLNNILRQINHSLEEENPELLPDLILSFNAISEKVMEDLNAIKQLS